MITCQYGEPDLILCKQAIVATLGIMHKGCKPGGEEWPKYRIISVSCRIGDTAYSCNQTHHTSTQIKSPKKIFFLFLPNVKS